MTLSSIIQHAPQRRPRLRSPWRHDLRIRAVGLALTGGAAAVGFGIAPLVSMSSSILVLCLQLVAFCLACGGMLLLIEGGRLRDGWTRAIDPRRARSADPVGTRTTQQVDLAVLWDMGLGGGRMALTTFLILRAQQHGSRASAADQGSRAAPAILKQKNK